jgi:hypothetical protein
VATPVIRHTGVQQSLAGAAIPINAYVVGTTAAPSLFYRSHAGGNFVKVTMTKSQAGVWQATIPADAVTTNGVEYYLTVGSTRDPLPSTVNHFVAVPYSN